MARQRDPRPTDGDTLDEAVGTWLAAALEAPPPMPAALPELLARRLAPLVAGAPARRGPRPVLWLVPLALLGATVTLVWLVSNLGLPAAAIVASAGSAMAAVAAVGALVGRAVALPALCAAAALNAMVFLVVRQRTEVRS